MVASSQPCSFFDSSGSSSNYFIHVVYVGFLEAFEIIPRTHVLFSFPSSQLLYYQAQVAASLSPYLQKLERILCMLSQICDDICSIEKLITPSPSFCRSIIRFSQNSLVCYDFLQPSYKCRIRLNFKFEAKLILEYLNPLHVKANHIMWYREHSLPYGWFV